MCCCVLRYSHITQVVCHSPSHAMAGCLWGAASAKQSAPPLKDAFCPPAIVCRFSTSLGAVGDKQNLLAPAAEVQRWGIARPAECSIPYAVRAMATWAQTMQRQWPHRVRFAPHASCLSKKHMSKKHMSKCAHYVGTQEYDTCDGTTEKAEFVGCLTKFRTKAPAAAAATSLVICPRLTWCLCHLLWCLHSVQGGSVA